MFFFYKKIFKKKCFLIIIFKNILTNFFKILSYAQLNVIIPAEAGVLHEQNLKYVEVTT